MSKPWVPIQKQLTVEERLKLLLIWRLVKKSDKDNNNNK